MRQQIERWRALKDLDDWLRAPMLMLSLAWLALIVIDLTGETSPLLGNLAVVIWIIFIAEFVIRFVLAPRKRAFLKRNWLTLIALIVPALRLFRALAILRAARGLRLIRIVTTANRSMRALQATLRRRQFGYVTALTGLVIALGAAGMLNFEPASEVEGGFAGYWDALWWTAMLLTTIGSQFWPVTTEGRVLALLLSIYGLAVLGYLTATIASFFIGRDAEDHDAPVAGAAELAELKAEVAALRRAIESSRATPPG
ncbi:potassium channel family protein [Parafrankia sp. BMG5.11]|uniref:potassium channel family protein n=1 Tax=Parafrankia sp. BMG5.11 TaxID=222540 RepID=UPI00103D284E|nr:potassium channel family protein [Parafrankia sp. BMG5.11]TCJ38994.1 potassium channel protein [Parafrankia sp. BMG5.11]